MGVISLFLVSREKNLAMEGDWLHSTWRPSLLILSPLTALSNHTGKNLWHQCSLQVVIIVPLSDSRLLEFSPFCSLCCSSLWMWTMRSKVQKCNWSSVESYSLLQNVITAEVPAMTRSATSVQLDECDVCVRAFLVHHSGMPLRPSISLAVVCIRRLCSKCQVWRKVLWGSPEPHENRLCTKKEKAVGQMGRELFFLCHPHLS